MQDTAYHHLQTTLMLVMTLSLPALVVATLVGLLVGLLQAATQVQDQTLPVTVKVMVVLAVIAFAGPLLAGPLVEEARRLFTDFPSLTR